MKVEVPPTQSVKIGEERPLNLTRCQITTQYCVFYQHIDVKIEEFCAKPMQMSGQSTRANKLNLIQRLVLSVTQLQCAAAAALLKPALVTMKKLNFKFESLISQDVQNQFWYKCLMGYKVKWRFKTLSFCKTLLNNVVGSVWRYAMQWTEFLWNFNDFLPSCFIWTVLFIFPCLGLRSAYDLSEVTMKSH